MINFAPGLNDEYARGPRGALYAAKLSALARRYANVRRIRGVGNCFYRSFWMGWLEEMVESPRCRPPNEMAPLSPSMN